MKKISIYDITNMATIIDELFINYEITTPKSCHDATALCSCYIAWMLRLSLVENECSRISSKSVLARFWLCCITNLFPIYVTFEREDNSKLLLLLINDKVAARSCMSVCGWLGPVCGWLGPVCVYQVDLL